MSRYLDQQRWDYGDAFRADERWVRIAVASQLPGAFHLDRWIAAIDAGIGCGNTYTRTCPRRKSVFRHDPNGPEDYAARRCQPHKRQRVYRSLVSDESYIIDVLRSLRS